MELTQTQIEAINKECPYGQGIFREPFGIPNHIKELCVYTKWESGGRNGSCWDDEDTVNEDYTNDRPSDAFKVLDLTLKVLKPDITFLQFKEIQNLVHSNTETDYGYYGDYTEDTIEWIVLPELYEALAKF
jgi:hypothetical protein